MRFILFFLLFMTANELTDHRPDDDVMMPTSIKEPDAQAKAESKSGHILIILSLSLDQISGSTPVTPTPAGASRVASDLRGSRPRHADVVNMEISHVAQGWRHWIAHPDGELLDLRRIYLGKITQWSLPWSPLVHMDS